MKADGAIEIKSFEDDGYWWCQIVQHGAPVPAGALPNLGRMLCWSGKTREEARARAAAFIAGAQRAIGGVA